MRNVYTYSGLSAKEAALHGQDMSGDSGQARYLVGWGRLR
jgi:hypothetical protein